MKKLVSCLCLALLLGGDPLFSQEPVEVPPVQDPVAEAPVAPPAADEPILEEAAAEGRVVVEGAQIGLNVEAVEAGNMVIRVGQADLFGGDGAPIEGRVVFFDPGEGVLLDDVFDSDVEVAKDGIRLAEKMTDRIGQELELHLDLIQHLSDVSESQLRLLRGCGRRILDEQVAGHVTQESRRWRYNGQAGRSALGQVFSHELWKRCYNGVLSVEQRSRFEEAQEARKKTHTKADVDLMMAGLDARLCLSEDLYNLELHRLLLSLRL